MPTAQSVFSRNRLLGSMHVEDFNRLRPHLERVTLAVRDVLEEPNQPIEYVYFLEPAVGSIVATTYGGERLEVGIFGPEGMSGLPIVYGADRSPLHTFIQVPGGGLRMPAEALRQALAESARLHRMLLIYAQAHAIQVAYTVLANGRFTLEERLARWLLMCHDRVDGNIINLTHEFLALMLGVRRAGVTTAMGALQQSGIISMTRGRIEVIDRGELENMAGESYGAAEAEYERLFASI